MSGYIGYRKVPTVDDASSVWNMRDQAKFQKDGIWPITLPELYWNNVSLLLHLDSDLSDSSNNSVAMTANGNAAITTSVKKYGAGSLVCDGTDDYLYSASSSLFNVSSGDWTMEGYYYFNQVTSGLRLAVLEASSSDMTGFYINGSGQLVYGKFGSTEQPFGAFSTTGSFVHIAFVKNGSTLHCYINGTQLGSGITPSAAPTNSNTILVIGASRGSYASGIMNGYIDEVRFTKGVARYTGNFTTLDSPFPSL